MPDIPSPETYEKLGLLYLGREYDLRRQTLRDPLLLYDSKDLTTHAVCVGMTGSGKTGLCVDLLEEAALDGIPSLVIDPKGDLTNLLLTFPDLAPEDFEPWVDPAEAARRALSVPEFARAQARFWKDGLASWGQAPERIGRLRRNVDLAIYTPGSDAGRPLSVLSSFAAPEAEILDDPDALREQVTTAVNGLLGLIGIGGDPLRSREHILLSTILERTWQQRQDLDLGRLIQSIQEPPVGRLGVMDLESFYPRSERFELSLALNNLLAAPSFAAWRAGEPLDVAGLLYTSEGKPRVSILYLAHLSEAERMFVLTLLLNRVIGWMRSRSGTSSLRALLYIDEILGYLPPVAEPPSKRPLLTLLKQARAYGLGLVVATQNPVDLDYKALSNAGTWLIGRLQTERDKQRVLAGLEGVAAGPAGEFDRNAMEQTLAGLGKRVFLMHNVHEQGPVVFQSRWAMSYLRGPLTREQIRRLEPGGSTPKSAPPTAADTRVPIARPGADASGAAASAMPPMLPPDLPVVYLPLRAGPTGGEVVYVPRLLGNARLRFIDGRRRLDAGAEELTLLAEIRSDAPLAVDWEAAATIDVDHAALLSHAPVPGIHAPVPEAARHEDAYSAWEQELEDWLYRERRGFLFRAEAVEATSEPGETEREFRVRIAEAVREERDARVEKLRAKYASKLASIQERVRKAEAAVDREREQAKGASLQAAISVGATVLSTLLGRKSVSATTLGKATTAARGAGRAAAQTTDVARAEADVEAYREQLGRLEEEVEAEVAELQQRLDPARLDLARIEIPPRKSDVDVRMVALAWAPVERDAAGLATPLFG